MIACLERSCSIVPQIQYSNLSMKYSNLPLCLTVFYEMVLFQVFLISKASSNLSTNDFLSTNITH